MRKEFFCTIIGAVASGIIGNWGPLNTSLLICQSLDLITGLIVATVFKKSTKSKSGGAESFAMFKGLCRKFGMWCMIAVAHQLDITMGIDYIAVAATYAFIANEALSLVENCGLMGIVKNEVIINAIDVLKRRSSDPNN